METTAKLVIIFKYFTCLKIEILYTKLMIFLVETVRLHDQKSTDGPCLPNPCQNVLANHSYSY